MHRLAAVVIPILAAFIASTWLYGWPSSKQRSEAPMQRRRVVLVTSVVTAILAIGAFFTRDLWLGNRVSSDVGLSIFLGLILLVVALLYAAVPPQKDL